MEVVRRQDDGLCGERAFARDVGRAELRLADGYGGGAVAVPQDVRPVAAVGVERAAVVEEESGDQVVVSYELLLKLPCFAC